MFRLLERVFSFSSSSRTQKRVLHQPIRFRPRVEQLESRLVPANVFWDGGGVNNLASNRFNWVGDVLPQMADTIVFDGTSNKQAVIDLAFHPQVASMFIGPLYNSTVTVERPFMVGTLTQSGSTINGPGMLTIMMGGTINASGAGGPTWAGAGSIVNQQGTLLIGGGLTIDQRTFINNSTVRWTDSDITMNNGATINNNAFGTFRSWAPVALGATDLTLSVQ